MRKNLLIWYNTSIMCGTLDIGAVFFLLYRPHVDISNELKFAAVGTACGPHHLHQCEASSAAY